MSSKQNRSGRSRGRANTVYARVREFLRSKSELDTGRRGAELEHEDALLRLWRAVAARVRVRPGGILGYEAEDIATEVIVALLRTPPEQETATAYTHWIGLLVRRRIDGLLRMAAARRRTREHGPDRRAGAPLGSDGQLEARDPAPTPEEITIGRQELAAWRDAFADLASATLARLARTKLTNPEIKWWLLEQRCLHALEWDEIPAAAPPEYSELLAGLSRNTMQAYITKLLAQLDRMNGEQANELPPEDRESLSRLLRHLRSTRTAGAAQPGDPTPSETREGAADLPGPI